MVEPRLATHIWVAAYLRRMTVENTPAYVTRHGDDTAGAVLVKCATLDGNATLWRQEYDFATDSRDWRQIAEGAEAQIDAAIVREAAFDPDLWVIEVERRDGDVRLD